MKSLIKNSTFQMLLWSNVIVVILSVVFFWYGQHTNEYAMIVASGWTSILALVLGDYLGIKALQMEMTLGTITQDDRVKAGLIQLNELFNKVSPQDIERLMALIKTIDPSELTIYISKIKLILDRL